MKILDDVVPPPSIQHNLISIISVLQCCSSHLPLHEHHNINLQIPFIVVCQIIINMDSISQETLRRVESNDDTLTMLKIKNCNFDRNGRFNSSDGRDFSTLGSSIGENTHLTTLVITPNDKNLFDVTNRRFFDGLRHNYSIHSLVLHCDMHEIVGGVGHEVLNTYVSRKQQSYLPIHRPG